MVRPTTLPRPRPVVLLVAAVCALALIATLVGTGLVGASGDTLLKLEQAGPARPGELITVRLVANNASDLAGFQGTVQYDSAGLRLTGASVETGLERSGRGLVALGPVMRDGAVVLGAATCPVSDCGSTPGRAVPRVETGVSGTVELGTLEFYSTAPGTYQLTLDGVKFVDPQGNTLAVRAEPLVLEVKP
jgi:hypothetical protein